MNYSVMTSIISLLDQKHVFAKLEAKDKNEILTTLVSSFKGDVETEELDAIKHAVLEREKIMSTGVGKGLAIPHGKAPGISDNHVAFALLDEPVDYQSIDGEPVSMIFLLAGPSSSNSLHIKMLSRISRMMNNNTFREKLKACDSSEEIIDVFEQEEKALT
jgi:fructose-specific phosphotransferase system IIA component